MSHSENNWSTGVKEALIALPILYLLSTGPVVYIGIKVRHSLPPSAYAALDVFYLPIEILHEHTPLQVPIDLYVDWWIERSQTPP